MTDKRDPEAIAMGLIAKALDALDERQQERVLAWVRLRWAQEALGRYLIGAAQKLNDAADAARKAGVPQPLSKVIDAESPAAKSTPP
jgi:hypothetical protein